MKINFPMSRLDKGDINHGFSAMFDSILVVCVGNICRSPVGERLLKQLLPEKHIFSAGVGAVVGSGVDLTMEKVAKSHGLATAGHIARQITSDMCRKADLILSMSQDISEQIYYLAPEARGKVMLYGKWMDGIEIPDPFKQKEKVHERAYQLLAQGAESWVNIIRLKL